MGDVLSLIDKVQANIDEQEALDMAKKMRANDFTLEDFLAQMQQIKKNGALEGFARHDARHSRNGQA